MSHHTAIFRCQGAPERFALHGRLHRFKNDYRSLTDLPKVWRFTKVSRAPFLFKPHHERVAFGVASAWCKMRANPQWQCMSWRFADQLITRTSFRNVMGLRSPCDSSPRVSHDRDGDSGLGNASKLAAQCLDAREQFVNTGFSDATIVFNAQKFCATSFHFD